VPDLRRAANGVAGYHRVGLKTEHPDRGPLRTPGRGEEKIGGVVLSHRVPPAVPSAQRGLTSEFGMGSGGSPAPWPPINRDRERVVCVTSGPKRSARALWRVCHAWCARNEAARSGRVTPMNTDPSDPVKPHGPLVRLGSTCCHASTCRLSTWWSPTALQGSYDPGGFILGRASHLDAFSGSPVPAWLPGAASGDTTGTPEASPSRSSRTKDGFPQSSNAHDGYRPNCLTTF
jgi:hypothetical protein